MRIWIAGSFALSLGSSLQAQTIPDLGKATPVAGNWVYSSTGSGSEALFSNARGQPQLTIRCATATRRVTISKPASGAAPFLGVWTSSQSRNLPASFNPATMRLSADVLASDTLLDAIAFSRGRFGVAVSPQPALVVPAWAEPARVIEDCRA